MIKQTTDEKHYLNLAGEYGICSELAKRGIMANLIFGHHKAADVLVVNTNSKKAVIVEVKTTRSNRVVTSFFQKYKTTTTAPIEREFDEIFGLYVQICYTTKNMDSKTLSALNSDNEKAGCLKNEWK